tara:strand:+ start:4794 stop:5579 length:786 start_codon:yes stop_codon:yes gene_type:complete
MSLNNVEIFKEKIARRELCIGTSITFTDSAISELAGDAGCDFTWIDMEHCPIDINMALLHVMATRGTDAAPFVRVPSADPVLIKPILELHPAAIIVPMVKSSREVEHVVSACKYPPRGNRGFGPRRGRLFGGQSYPEYLKNADEQIMVMVQIEHVDAVDAIEEILSIEGLDGICIGFNDLAGSVGLSGQIDHPDVREMAETVIKSALENQKITGLAMGFDLEVIAHYHQLGIQWISIGGDFNLLYSKLREVVSETRSLSKG